MTIRTFWTIFLKIFGLYLIWQTFLFLPSMFASIAMQVKIKIFSTIPVVIEIAFMITFFTIIFWCCLFKNDWLIEKLKLEKGFTNKDIEINLHRSSLLSIAVIVLGGLMLVDSLPLLLYDIFSYAQHSDQTFKDNHSSPYIVSNFLKILIGYFMVADSRLIVNFIERKRKKAVIAQVSDVKEKDELQ